MSLKVKWSSCEIKTLIDKCDLEITQREVYHDCHQMIKTKHGIFISRKKEHFHISCYFITTAPL